MLKQVFFLFGIWLSWILKVGIWIFEFLLQALSNSFDFGVSFEADRLKILFRIDVFLTCSTLGVSALYSMDVFEVEFSLLLPSMPPQVPVTLPVSNVAVCFRSFNTGCWLCPWKLWPEFSDCFFSVTVACLR